MQQYLLTNKEEGCIISLHSGAVAKSNLSSREKGCLPPPEKEGDPGMDMTREQILDKLLKAYSHSYDIERDVQIGDTDYPAMAIYFLRDENYVISRKNVISATENHEYVYFLLTEHLGVEDLQRHIETTKADGLGRIKPSKEHMSSMVTLIIVADTIDAEAKDLIKKTRFHKNYRLALHGWMEYHVAAMEISTKSFLSNPAGKGAKKSLEQNFGSG